LLFWLTRGMMKVKAFIEGEVIMTVAVHSSSVSLIRFKTRGKVAG